MNHSKPYLILLLLALPFLLAATSLQDTIPNPPFEELSLDDQVALLINTPFPSFSAVNLDGDTIHSKDLLDKIAHINVWSRTCMACILEMPQLNEIQNAYQDKVVFLGITPDSTKAVLDFLKKQEFNYTILRNNKSIMDTFGINIQPLNIFINKKGVVQYLQYGIPVSPKGSGKKELLVFERYSALLEEMLKE